MKKTIIGTALFVLATLLSSCGLARGVSNTVSRTVQTVGRTIF